MATGFHATVLCLCALAVTAATPANAAERPFAPNSIWNAPVAADAPLDPDSAGLVGELRRQVDTYVPWINTTAFSTPVYRVPANQRTVRVVLDADYPPLQRAWEKVPMPRDARPSGGSDGQLVVWQPSRDRMWEFFMLRNVAGVWHARWGGRMTHVSQSRGYYAGRHRNWGATATSLPLFGGLITFDDLARGRIDHAIAVGIPQAQSETWAWPAQRTDGSYDGPHAIPEGTRFRLDPRLDVGAMRLAPLVKMLARAAQRYGIIVRDQSGSVAFAGQDPTPIGRDPWTGPGGWFGGQSPAALMRQFPWQYLRAVRSRKGCCSHR